MTYSQQKRLEEIRSMEMDGVLDHSVGSKDQDIWAELEELERLESDEYIRGMASV